jgi:hypothetical protein
MGKERKFVSEKKSRESIGEWRLVSVQQLQFSCGILSMVGPK